MAKKAYILVFDRDDNMDFMVLHKNITTLPEVTNWFHYIKSSYILISTLSSSTKLNGLLAPFFPKGKSILLIEVNLKNRNGLLVPKAWDWLKSQQTQVE